MVDLVAWEIISDYAYVFLSVVGVIAVLAIVYRNRQKDDADE